eukprot:scaffold9940_cov113-Skeletonema_marinoi.AAC.2
MPRCCMILLCHASLQQHFRSRIGRIPSTMTEKDRKEVLPPDMPEPRGKGFVICCSTDAYELVIRSRGNLVLRQGSVDSSTYQAESTQYIRALRYLLRII